MRLDALLRLEMRAELKRLLSEIGSTTVYVTHDQVEAMSMGDRIAVMRSSFASWIILRMVCQGYPSLSPIDV